MTRIKICGITRLEDALLAVECGANAIGFVLWRGSPRAVRIDRVRQIIRQLPPFVSKVGVFVDQTYDEIAEAIEQTGIDTIQLHGGESPEFCEQFRFVHVIKAFRVKDESVLQGLLSYKVNGWLLDGFAPHAPGGTGKAFPWHVARQAKGLGKPIIIAGGLTPQNVADVVRLVRPYAVDVSSGVEISPGVKDAELVRRFCEAVRQVDSELEGR